jgi:dTDP-4-amino-4,6-dideoxygalactose transaminase
MKPTTYAIPFNRPSLAGREFRYMSAALRRGHISGDGVFTARCQALLERELGVPKALLTTSGTHALEMAALLLELRPGDEVVLPSFTFVSTANAFVLRGARPVFVDIRPDTLNLDEALLEAQLTARTRAIVVVHYAGVGCEMKAILKLARRHHLPVIEDNAHGLFGKYRGQPLGSFGVLAAQSFHETKNVTCGEGGALLLNDRRLIARAELLREKGTDRSRFFRGEVDKYTWRDLGSSYVPSDLLAAFLLAQFEARRKSQRQRRHLWETYFERLRDWAGEHGVSLPFVPEHCASPWHLFHLVMPTPAARQALLAALRARGILGTFHYLPLHSSPMGRRHGRCGGRLPVTEHVSARLLRLPLFAGLTPREQERVLKTVLAFKGW